MPAIVGHVALMSCLSHAILLPVSANARQISILEYDLNDASFILMRFKHLFVCGECILKYNQ